MSNNNKMPSPCIGKNCKQKAGCPRHRLMEIEVATVLNDVRERLTSGEVNMNDFCKMWKAMRGNATSVKTEGCHIEHCNTEDNEEDRGVFLPPPLFSASC